MATDCIFCRIVAGEVPNQRVFEDEATYAFMDVHPATDGHVLVIPKRHSRDLLEIPATDLDAVMRTAQRIATAMPDTLGSTGVNLISNTGADAWQSVFHFHVHVVPRYPDPERALVPPWRPGVPGDPAVIAALGERLTDALG